MSHHHNYVAILAGGIGSRFWPLSRTKYPKQFLDILGTGKSLIQWTYERFKHVCPKENIYFITNKDYVDAIKEQLPEVSDVNIIAEPSRKNTAPCAAYFAHKIAAKDPLANIVMSPADHLIMDDYAFKATIDQGLELVSQSPVIATLGVRPTRPDTGYGYIQHSEKKEGNAFKVKVFTEKPTLEIAKTFIESGDFLWNSGIFIWNVSTILKALKEYLPEIDELFEQAKEVYNTPLEAQTMQKVYSQCTNISIDYGVMEKASNVYVLPASFGWCDLGTWESVFDNSDKDHLGNAVYGENVIVVDASECVIKAPDDKLLVVQGLENCIVVDTPDVLLICERSKEQEIKEYVNEIKRNKGDQYL